MTLSDALKELEAASEISYIHRSGSPEKIRLIKMFTQQCWYLASSSKNLDTGRVTAAHRWVPSVMDMMVDDWVFVPR